MKSGNLKTAGGGKEEGRATVGRGLGDMFGRVSPAERNVWGRLACSRPSIEI